MSWQKFWSKKETVDELIARLEKERTQIVRDIHKSRLCDRWWLRIGSALVPGAVGMGVGGVLLEVVGGTVITGAVAVSTWLEGNAVAAITATALAAAGPMVLAAAGGGILLATVGGGAYFFLSDTALSKRRKGIEKIQALGRQLVEAQIVKILLAGPRERVRLIINPSLGEEGEIDIFYTSKLDNKTENPPAPDKLPNEVRPILLSDSIWNDAGKIWCAGGLFDSFLKRDLESMSPEERRAREILTLFKEEHKQYNCIEKMLIEILSRRVNPEIFLEEVDLRHVGLTPEKLRNLISAGIERYGLVSLVLSHNRLDASSVGVLRQAVNHGDRFRQLKELHLNDNALQGRKFVDHIIFITFTLRLQTLNLSMNRQLGTSIGEEKTHPFQRFLSEIPTQMRSLMRLELRNVGFQAAQAPALSRALEEILLLEYLDLRENPDLIYADYSDVIITGLRKGVSLKTMLVDNVGSACVVNKVLESHRLFFDQLKPIVHRSQPRLIMLLNCIMLGEDIPETFLNFIAGTSFSCISCDEIVKAISGERVAALRMNNDLRIPIHEQEYIAYLDIASGRLRDFYYQVAERVRNRDVEESLLALVQERQALQALAVTHAGGNIGNNMLPQYGMQAEQARNRSHVNVLQNSGNGKQDHIHPEQAGVRKRNNIS